MKKIFDGISPRNQEKILQFLEAQTLSFKKNTTILKSVKQDNFIGIVLEGYLKIIKNDYDGNSTIIEELEDNDLFGAVVSSLSNSEYDLITFEDSKVVIFDYERLFWENNAPYFRIFINNFMDILTHKVKNTNERIEILTTKTIRHKLLEYFNINSKKNNSRIIYLPFNYLDLADYLAVDRCAMSREIKNLKDEGMIEVDGKKITLLYYFK